MPKVLDNTPCSETVDSENTQSSTRGRVRRPSEKVQAMLDDYEQEKVASQKKAETMAKRRKELTQKRVQAAKAAEQVIRRSEAQHEDQFTGTGEPAILADSAFTSRSVGGHETMNARMALATPLVVRSGTVPPAPSGTPMVNQPPRVRALARTETLITPQGILRYQDSREPVTSRKRVHEHETPTRQEIEQRILHQGYDSDSDDLVFKKRACILRCEDNDETDEVLSDVECQQAEDIRTHGSVKDEPMDVNISNLKPPTLSLQLASTGSESKGRPKAGNYDLATRQVLETAIEIYCAILLTETPFPTATQEVNWTKAAWQVARQHHESDLDHDITLLKLIMARSCHLRGQFKSKARLIVATTFGFETSTTKAVQQQNRNLVIELKKNSSFIYRTRSSTLDQHEGIYQNKGIQQLINEVLFKNKSDHGIKWAKYYNPFPTSGFALALTALQCAIDEWASGSREPVPFKEYEYSSIFAAHFQSLSDFAAASAKYNLVPKLMQQVYDNGRVHANVEMAAVPAKMSAVPQQAFMNAIRDYERTEIV